MNKRVISFFTLIAMITSLFGVFSTAVAANDIKMMLNGNELSSTQKEVSVDNGIFSAQTEGSGLFAIGAYKGGELVSLDFAQGNDLSGARLNMVVDSDSESYSDIKLFRFDEDGNPVCINHILKPTLKDNDLRIYFNETFDNNESNYTVNGTSVSIVDEKVKISGKNKYFPNISVMNPERYTVVEFDYEITSDAWPNVYVICGYDTGYQSFIRMRNSGLYAGDGMKTGSRAPGISRDDILNEYYGGKEIRKFHFSVLIDSQEKKFKVFLEEKELTFTDYENSNAPVTWMNIGSRLDTTTMQSGFSVQLAHTAEETTVYIDNLKAYSVSKDGEFLDIGNDIQNTYKTDYANSDNTYSSRPEAAEIAKKVLASGHPRVMIDADRVSEIKNSTDENIKKWKDEIVAKADALISTKIYEYKDFNPTDTSLDHIADCLAHMMNLGLAYQLSDDAAKKAAYADRAYRQAEVLMSFEGYHSGAYIQNDWNSDSYLDVGEISAIMSVCYDWMYDAWTPEQKKAITDAVMECSIDISYKTMFGQSLTKAKNKTDLNWMKNTNNWNAVCNGGVLTAAIAFMEEDIYRCSKLAEGTIRGFEHLLPTFAPDGGWYEGTGYWNYTMKYLTIACSTLKASCGTLFGLENTPGFERSQTYAIDLEGANGSFAFGDGGGEHIKSPYMYFWAEVYKNSKIGGAAKYAMDRFSFNTNAFDLIYYNPDYVDTSYTREQATYRQGTEVVVLASGYDKDDTVVALTGGPGTATSHDHIDSGSVIVDINGMRLIGDTGAEHYDATGYFADGRYYYYKARPEGHNVFVINPQVLSDGDGNFYHGQSKKAVSTATLDKETGVATMNLSQAYERDADRAERKIYLTQSNGVVIEDEIEIKSDGSLVEWYYHFRDIISYIYNDSTYYMPNTFENDEGVPYCNVEIDNENKCVYITYQAFTVNGKNNVTLDGTYKKYKITFDSDSDFTIERRDAERNPYDAEVLEELRNHIEDGEPAPKFQYDYYTYADLDGHHKYSDNGETYPMDKIVVVMDDAIGTINLKATIEAVEE